MFSVSCIISCMSGRRDMLDCEVPPSIINNGQMTNEVTVIKGQSLVLTCSLHAIPLPTIIWTKGNQPLSDSHR